MAAIAGPELADGSAPVVPTSDVDESEAAPLAILQADKAATLDELRAETRPGGRRSSEPTPSGLAPPIGAISRPSARASAASICRRSPRRSRCISRT
jgi:hypothetical protein